MTNIVKVRYGSDPKVGREYSYYTEDVLVIGDRVNVPTKNGTMKAIVTGINVQEYEIAAFKESVKTIPAGSRIIDEARELLTHHVPANEQIENDLEPGTDLDIISYHDEAVKLRDYAEKLTIATLDDMKVATDDLTIIATFKKAMEAKRKEYLEPLQAEVKAINENYKNLMAPVLEAEDITKKKMLAYNHEQARIRAEQEEINRKRQEAAEAEMKLKGEISEPVNIIEVTPEPAKKTSTVLGTASQRDNWKFRIVDVDALPREYMIPDEVLLTRIAKTQHDKKRIAGVEFYNDPIMATRRR